MNHLLQLKAMFDRLDCEYLKFSRIEKPPSPRPDVCAFLMLDQIVPPKKLLGGCEDIVATAEHDEIWLNVDLWGLARVATEDQIRDLIRCGVRLDTSNDCLAMFV